MFAESPFLLTTSSGNELDLSDPLPPDIAVEDIARALSKICRFGAQATAFYSVAQHALEVAARVPDELALAALHHDSHEAFAGDLPTPLKHLIRTSSPVYDELCQRLDLAIGAAFGIDPTLFEHPEVKRADEVVRVLESRDLLADGGVSVRRALPSEVSPHEEDSVSGRVLAPEDAELAFLAAHSRYDGRGPGLGAR